MREICHWQPELSKLWKLWKLGQLRQQTLATLDSAVTDWKRFELPELPELLEPLGPLGPLAARDSFEVPQAWNANPPLWHGYFSALLPIRLHEPSHVSTQLLQQHSQHWYQQQPFAAALLVPCIAPLGICSAPLAPCFLSGDLALPEASFALCEARLLPWHFPFWWVCAAVLPDDVLTFSGPWRLADCEAASILACSCWTHPLSGDLWDNPHSCPWHRSILMLHPGHWWEPAESLKLRCNAPRVLRPSAPARPSPECRLCCLVPAAKVSALANEGH